MGGAREEHPKFGRSLANSGGAREEHPKFGRRLAKFGMRSGGTCNFLKLTRFRGQDYGKSKFIEKEQEVEKV